MKVELELNDDIMDVLDAFEDTVGELVDSDQFEEVSDWDRIGLDPRSSVSMWVESGGHRIITKGSTRSLEYYGGFEYVDSDAVTRIGPWTIWDGDEDERVQGHVDRWNGEEDDEDE